ncbi:MAG: sulfotransferase [Acidimicrobiia bacterium]|nr:sulfotransferase [Acidimicrobiia bacterium]
MDQRLPDIVVIGAMKAGTTSLYRWLEQHPRVEMPARKEPETLLRADDPAADYSRLLGAIDPDALTVDASARYGHPDEAPRVARTVAHLLPDARLVYLVRDPEQRLRSHYRHQHQRGRERRSLVEAVTEPGNPYVAHSCYADVVEAYDAELGPGRLHVWSFERLVGDDGTEWSRLLAGLDLAPMPRPDDAYNTDRDKGQFRPWTRALYDRGLVAALPRPLRRLRRLGVDDSARARARRAQAGAEPLPADVRALLAEQAARLRARVGDPAIV